MMSVAENWMRFQDDLIHIANRCHRNVNDIAVMAVSKTRTAEEIAAARAAGLAMFGENRVDEAAEKFARFDTENYPLYLIGHLQSNKVNRISARFSGLHSLDSLALAEKLSRHREKLKAPLEVLIQVNTSGEAEKSGFRNKAEFVDAAAKIANLPFLELKGLMTMAPFVEDEIIIRRCFARCREWVALAEKHIHSTPILSMGMSSDYHWAIAEGSTLLRIGTIIFGVRD
ncbi:MAG: YggS family pyridoxal phosphate enzyme [Spirochaeta sp. LUC14_002_19_P3]|nr:MAG: YggS family pyridoxal phosphate enzyme [Spirochaeta sp. LUC14_002_19_P3]